MNRNELLGLLQTALKEPERRSEIIKRFQVAVFDGNQAALGLNEADWDVFTQLAQDLDYYESDPEMRQEDPSYFGEQRAETEISEALQKLLDPTEDMSRPRCGDE
jgi:hypothetical protein